MSARIVVPMAVLGGLLAGLVVVGACALLLLFNFARATENLAFGGAVAGVETTSGAPVPSAEAQADIPPLYLALYRQAASRFGLDWAILAGIGRVECDHGRDPAPSCTVEGQLNHAGAGGPAQFLVSTWQRYGISATGHGPPDMWRPADAILSMANYLHAAGAPGDYRRAIYAYNHAWWYVADVLAWAQRYRAAFADAPSATAVVGAIVRLPVEAPWLAPLPGTALRCDARVIADVEYILARFGLRATSCYRDDGPNDHGEHPLGVALDAVPTDGAWSRALAAAQAFGWQAACGSSGCADRLRAPMRFIGYNGYPGHGDPARRCQRAHPLLVDPLGGGAEYAGRLGRGVCHRSAGRVRPVSAPSAGGPTLFSAPTRAYTSPANRPSEAATSVRSRSEAAVALTGATSHLRGERCASVPSYGCTARFQAPCLPRSAAPPACSSPASRHSRGRSHARTTRRASPGFRRSARTRCSPVSPTGLPTPSIRRPTC